MNVLPKQITIPALMVKLVLLLLIFTADFSGSSFAGEPESSFKVMSFNIRYGTAKDGENAWEHRKSFVVETIKKFDPDLLGTQETLEFQKDYLEKHLPGYGVWGVGRNDGKLDGEMMAIFYRKDRFKKLEGGHFWLSETPQVVGSKSWDSSLPRMASWLKLSDRKVKGKTLYFINTHYDHRGPEARKNSSRVILAQIKKLAGNKHVVVTGDFNAAQGSVPYQTLFETQSPNPRLIDTFRATHPSKTKTEGTFSGFQASRNQGARIDWIAATPDFKLLSAEIDQTSKQGRTPSDHLPVNAIFAWK